MNKHEWYYIIRKLELGKDYNVWFYFNKKMNCRFIKVTAKGYNFLNLETNKCILKHHLSQSTKDKDMFFKVTTNLHF